MTRLGNILMKITEKHDIVAAVADHLFQRTGLSHGRCCAFGMTAAVQDLVKMDFKESMNVQDTCS